MIPARKTLLDIVKNSRVATEKMATLEKNGQLTIEKAERLLDQGAIIAEATFTPKKQTNQKVGTPFIKTIIESILERDDAGMISCLWTAGDIDTNARQQWLWKAIIKDADKSLGSMISMGALDALSNEQKAELLWLSAASEKSDSLRHLLQAGLDPNLRHIQADNQTALFRSKTLENTKLLVEAGGDPNAMDGNGHNPLQDILIIAEFESKRSRRPERQEKASKTMEELLLVARYLIEQGAAITSTRKNGTKWNILENLNRMSADCTIVLEVIRDRINPKKLKNRIRSPALALSLLKLMPDLDPTTLMNSSGWHHINIKEPETQETVEILFSMGVVPPKLQHLAPGGSEKTKHWLEFGIPVTQEDIEKLREYQVSVYDGLYSEEYEYFKENNEIEIEYEDNLVKSSNAKALLRIADVAMKTKPQEAKPKI